MQIIDLSMPLYSGMPVFPGDPEVEISLIQNFSEHGWNMHRAQINLHDGTHVNVPFHGTADGKTLDDYKLDKFIGESVIFETLNDIKPGIGLISAKHDIDWNIAKVTAERQPKFIGLTAEFDVEIEKYLLEKDIISFERLINTDKLPKQFVFHGAPLNIRQGDGSPVRAYAVFQ